jgi:glycerophosphoryl diester phosphodiesterase
MNKWLVKQKRPYNIAHRGASNVAPENTIMAFERALAVGADGVEFDVMQCRSGEIVVFHDEKVDRLTDGKGFVAKKTLDELKELDVSGDYHDDVGRVEIPTLDEVLDRLDRSMLINIEVKSESFKTDGIEDALVKTLRRHALADNILVSSFNPMVLRRLRFMAPELLRALIISPTQKFYYRRLWLARLAQPAFLHPHIDMVRSETMETWRARGYHVSPWVVNRTAAIKQMYRYGAHSIISDDPAKVSAALGKRRRF